MNFFQFLVISIANTHKNLIAAKQCSLGMQRMYRNRHICQVPPAMHLSFTAAHAVGVKFVPRLRPKAELLHGVKIHCMPPCYAHPALAP